MFARTTLKTKAHPWLLLKTTTTKASLSLSSLASGGGWDRRYTIGARNLQELFRGDIPNAVKICPFMYNTSVNDTFKFRVDVYRGGYAWLDRICAVTAVTGAYKLSALPPVYDNTGSLVAGATITSAFFADTLTVTDYDGGVSDSDAGGAEGKGYLEFDLDGATEIAVNLVSTIETTKTVGFAITGF